MKVIHCFSCIFFVAFSSFAQLELTFTNINSTEGKLVLSIHESEDSFLSKETAIKTAIAVKGTEVRYRHDDLKPGNYAVRVFHDLNDNDELDKNFIGIPKEPYGVSNNAKERFGPPKYEKARFYYDGTPMSLSIELDEH